MTYKTIKRLILWTPTVTIALWEYLRHAALLPYLSMQLGNLLAPVIVFLVTVTLLYKLFAMLEDTQEALQRERLLKAALEEREQLARELHDGISQSLFMLSVKLDKLDMAKPGDDIRAETDRIRHTIRHVYDNVRQSIAALREPPVLTDLPWLQSVKALAEEIGEDDIRVILDWRLSDHLLAPKEKAELLAIVREAMLNVRKHAQAQTMIVACEPYGAAGGFRCTVADDGRGAHPEQLKAKGRFGVRMMEMRAAAMGWQLRIAPNPPGGILPDGGGVCVEIIRNGGDGE